MTKFTITLVASLLFVGSAPAKQAEGKAEDKTEASSNSAEEPEKKMVNTPFGPAPRTDPAAAPKPRKKAPSGVAVKQEGDSYRFSRKTPFGVQTWTRAKADLSAAEKSFIEEAGLSLDSPSAKPKP